MKKLLVACLAFVLSLSFTNKTNAQQPIKIGTFDEQQIIGLMPGITKVDTLISDYVTDSLKPEYDLKMADYNYKDSAYKRDSAGMSPSLREVRKNELTKATYEIANWNQYYQQKVQAKQQEFLQPFYDKIGKAFQEVVKEQKYTHVFASNAILWAADDKIGADIPLRILAKLNITNLPQEIKDQMKALGITPGGGSAAPATPAKSKF